MTASPDDPTTDWTRPGIYAVAPGVHRVPLPLPQDGLRAVNIYVLETEDGLTLIDSGWAIEEARETLAKGLASIGAGLGDIRRFLITHVHRDHYCHAVMLRREFGQHISLGIGERLTQERANQSGGHPFDGQLARLRRSGAQELIDELDRAFGRRKTASNEFEPPDAWITDGSSFAVGQRRLDALHTPGHTNGHVVFRDEAGGLLFAGDHVLPHITPSLGFESSDARYPLRDFIDSLHLVRGLPDTRLLPAHGPVTGSVHTRVDELLAHHDARLTASAEAVNRGDGTAYATAQLLTWTRRQRAFTELDVMNRMLAVTETMAHLDVLVLQGRLRCTESDGVAYFALP